MGVAGGCGHSALPLIGMMSATASLGLILLWDVDAGLTEIDKFLYATEDNIKVGYSLNKGRGGEGACATTLSLPAGWGAAGVWHSQLRGAQRV